MILGDVRDKLYHTRERSRQLLSNGISDIPEEATFTNVEQVSNLYTLNLFLTKLFPDFNNLLVLAIRVSIIIQPYTCFPQ